MTDARAMHMVERVTQLAAHAGLSLAHVAGEAIGITADTVRWPLYRKGIFLWTGSTLEEAEAWIRGWSARSFYADQVDSEKNCAGEYPATREG